MKFVKIVVTTREPKVLRKLDEENKIVLNGLDDDDYWPFFVSCAFGDTEPNGHSSLRSIGKQIMKKLKGSPLAAKTLGRLLEHDMSDEHWMDVLKSNLWELGTDADDIMLALALSYNHLPEHLQQCFVFCSVFPKNYEFKGIDLIEMWIAQGYVVETSSKTVEEMGHAYFDELLSRSFFEKKDSSAYTIHDLLHDLAQSVCLGECFIYQAQMIRQKSTSIRHMCLQRPVNDLRSVCNIKSLRTLVVLKGDLCRDEYEELKSIRVLIILDSHAVNYSRTIVNLRHLRYLDVSKAAVKEIDESLCTFYHLRVLGLQHLYALPEKLHNLINLRFLNVNAMPDSSLLFEHYPTLMFPVKEKARRYTVSHLRYMTELRGKLCISDLEKIENKEEAEEANMKEKSHLEGLALSWTDFRGSWGSTAAQEVLEGLQPNPNLRCLLIRRYKGFTCPSWFTPSSLHNLQFLVLEKCRNKLCLQSIGQLPLLSHLRLMEVNVTIDISDEVTILFRSLEKLVIIKASVSFEGSSQSRHSIFPNIAHIVYLTDGTFPWHMLSRVRNLEIESSPGLSDRLSCCLTSLEKLMIFGGRMVSFVGAMDTMKGVSELSIQYCNELTSFGGFHFMSSLHSLRIAVCQKFTSWISEDAEEDTLLQKLEHIVIYSCPKLKSLPTWLSHLPSLKELTIHSCRLIRSLPKGGLSSSLKFLWIEKCSQTLIARCKEEGSPEWLMIQHIPDRRII